MKVSSYPALVVFGDDWGRHVSSMQHVFRWIIPQRTVIWVNAIGHRKPALKRADFLRAWEKARAAITGKAVGAPMGDPQAPAPTTVIQPTVLPWHDYRVVTAFNRWSLLRDIRSALGRLKITGPPILVTGSPPSVSVVGQLGECAVIYFCMDDFPHLPSVSRGMMDFLERRLLEQTDAVVATASALADVKVPRTGQTYHLPQGVNYEHFARPRPEPPEVAALPHPRIGFAGGLFPRCDLALIRRLAKDHPRGSVVLVGPVAVNTRALDLPNIHILGPRPYEVLPAYVQAFDVGIIPYLINDETRSVDPLKLLEYLAAGIPTVSTAIPEAMKYSPVVRIGSSEDAFAAHVRAALTCERTATQEAAQAVARRNTWQTRADEFLRLLDSLACSHRAR